MGMKAYLKWVFDLVSPAHCQTYVHGIRSQNLFLRYTLQLVLNENIIDRERIRTKKYGIIY